LHTAVKDASQWKTVVSASLLFIYSVVTTVFSLAIYITVHTYIYHSSHIYITVHTYIYHSSHIYITVHTYISQFTHIYHSSHIYITVHTYISQFTHIYHSSHIYTRNNKLSNISTLVTDTLNAIN